VIGAGSFELDRAARAQIVEHSLGPVVEIELSPDGRQRFAALTQAQLGHRAAIVIDDEAVAVPVVREPILGGRVQVWPGAGEDPEAATQALLSRLGGG
jgi:preprotein translocase subunit SecD